MKNTAYSGACRIYVEKEKLTTSYAVNPLLDITDPINLLR